MSRQKEKLMNLLNDQNKITRSEANSLKEGLEKTLTLHNLGLNDLLGRPLSTTNCVENINSRPGSYLRKIKYWKTADMLARWICMVLIEIEPRLRKINN